MRKNIIFGFLIVIFELISGCTIQAYPNDMGAHQKTGEDPVALSVEVDPFYSSKKAQIQVGKYSDSLQSEDLEGLLKTVRVMKREKHLLSPEQMYVLSIQLYNLGAKDEGLYWFYAARYRTSLYVGSLRDRNQLKKDSKELKLWQAYQSFTDQIGKPIESHGAQNYGRWLNIIRKVRADNREIPDMATIFPNTSFVKKLGVINEKFVGIRLDELALYIEDKKVGGLAKYRKKQKHQADLKRLKNRMAKNKQMKAGEHKKTEEQ